MRPGQLGAPAGYANREMLYESDIFDKLTDKGIVALFMHELGHDLVFPKNMFVQANAIVIAANLAYNEGYEFKRVFGSGTSSSCKAFYNLVADEMVNYYQFGMNEKANKIFGVEYLAEGLKEISERLLLGGQSVHNIDLLGKVHIGANHIIVKKHGFSIYSGDTPEEAKKIYRILNKAPNWSFQERYRIYYDICKVFLSNSNIRNLLERHGYIKRRR